MKRVVWMILMFSIMCLGIGCVSKLVKIDSSPEFANIWINDAYVGKTPIYYEFSDECHLWPIKKTEDYVVKATLEGYDDEVQVFLDSPPLLDISYVPDEIFFGMHPVIVKELVK